MSSPRPPWSRPVPDRSAGAAAATLMDAHFDRAVRDSVVRSIAASAAASCTSIASTVVPCASGIAIARVYGVQIAAANPSRRASSADHATQKS